MKKIILFAIITVFLLTTIGVASAVKPVGNINGAEEVPWSLSGAVMPSPPWGLSDIPGSDTASKLIVNQPNGNVEVAVTGVMNGLRPNTEYTVYPSNAWLTSEKWNIVGDWSLRFMFGGAYDHDMTVAFQDMHTGDFSGTGHSTNQPSEKIWDIQGTSKVVGDTITLDLIYTEAGAAAGYTVHAVGKITDGKIIDGTWTSGSNQNGTWSSYLGKATEETVGNGWPGLFSGQETFTFMTDEFGSGSWHFNLKNDDFSGPGIYVLSVWINRGGTILISDNFKVTVD